MALAVADQIYTAHLHAGATFVTESPFFGYYSMSNPAALPSSEVGQHVSFSSVPILPPGTNRTLTFWWYPFEYVLAGNQRLLDCGNGEGHSTLFIAQGSEVDPNAWYLGYFEDSTSAAVCAVPGGLALQQWTHWAVVLLPSTGQVLVYRNSKLYHTCQNFAAPGSPSSAHCYVGRSSFPQDFLSTQRAGNVRVYNGQLSLAQLSQDLARKTMDDIGRGTKRETCLRERLTCHPLQDVPAKCQHPALHACGNHAACVRCVPGHLLE